METPRKFITAKLSIRIHIISTDEDPGLRIESFAVINLRRGVATNKNYYKQNYIILFLVE